MRDLFFRPGPTGNAVYIPSRYKVAYGGRGSGKSWTFAAMALALASIRPLRVLCVRELQNSIKESIHQLLSEQIERLGLAAYFDVQEKVILGRRWYDVMDDNGQWVKRRSEFIFAGVKSDPGKIKSLEGADICLVEEAEKVSKTSWEALGPTIRRPGAEIWVVFNPRDETDETYKQFVLHPPRGHEFRSAFVNWDDNPWFPQTLQIDRTRALERIEDAVDDDDRAQLQADYDHVWGGLTHSRSDVAIFRKRVMIHEFDEPPEKTRILFGADWGFAVDPIALIRFWVTDVEGIQELWISHEAFGTGVELDEIAQLFDSLPGSRKWPIKGDCSRPETISYVARQGFNLSAAEKWPGSVEDGISHIKGFRRIHMHTRCKRIQEEARLYSYKVDKITSEVLPIIVDKWNHGWDAVRYGLDGFIQRRGVAGQWARLARR